MKKIIKFTTILAFLLFTAISAKADFEISTNLKELGDIEPGQQVQFTIDITNWKVTGGSANAVSWTIPQGAAPWLEPISSHSNPDPMVFDIYSFQGETKTVTFTGIYDQVFGYQSFYMTFTDVEGTQRDCLITLTGVPPGGIEDRIVVTDAATMFSELDNIYYAAYFQDEDPYGDFVNDWFLDLNVFTTQGEIPYINLENTEYNYTSWSFEAPLLSNTSSYLWDDQGRIRGSYAISGTDNDGATHIESEDIYISKLPDKSNMRITYTGLSSIKIQFMNSGGSENLIYYGDQAGGPYNGTGLDQGDSPINIGNNTSIELTGLSQCSDYFFSGIANNSKGSSPYWDEVAVTIFDTENQAPLEFYATDVLMNNDYTYYGNHFFTGNLVIQSGATVTFDGGTQYFEENSHIIIESGGQLILDGATCTAPCGQTWQGIEVWGNATEHQFEYEGHPLAQGKLVLQNFASIQNAWNAVSTWKYDDWNTVGGIVIASNSSFVNNKRSVEFMPYQNYHPFSGEPMGYVSRFTNCQFIVDDNYVIPSFNSHITMCSVNGINISGCEFTNNITDAQHTGQGIFTIDAGYRITDYCDATVQPCPDTSITHSTFNNFYAGIIALNSGSPNTLYVNDALFVNNGIGIQLNTVDNATIIFNDFFIGPNTRAESSCTDGFGVGIDLINCNGYAIEENEFYPAQGMTSDAIGVNINYETEFVVHHPVMYNEIYNNIFDSVHVANNTQGKNFNADDRIGLVHLCNDNSNNVYDFYITDQGIQYLQGLLDEPAGNEFSLNANNPYSDYNNQSEWGITYFYEEGNAAETPVNYSDNYFPVDVENTNPCLSNYGDITKQDKGLGLTTSQLQHFINIYNTNKVDYLGTKALFESLKDGGDTPGTITDVEGAWPDEMWETRNDLLAKSPHLSREVLVETAGRTDLFPDAVIFEIFSANPDAMKDKTLLEYLETKENPLPQYMIDILAGSPGTISYKTILESDLAEYGGKKSRAANVIIRNILNDSLINTDSLVNWISNLGTMATDYQIIDVYLQRGDTSKAIALIDALPTDYSFETDNAEYIRYKTLKQFQVQLLAEGRNIYMLTTTEKTMLENMVANSSGRSGMQARNILQFVYGNEYNDCPNMPDPNTHKSANSSIYDLTSIMLQINASPNPAKNWVAFNYSFPEISTNSIIEIHNVKGELVHAINLTNYHGQKIWDTRKVLPGVYLFTLKSSGMIKSGKLIITK